jgi:hypothetical protein
MPDSTKSQQPKLLDQVRQVLRLHHYSVHPERSYVDWIVRFVRFYSMRSHEHLFPAEAKIESFLTNIAVHYKKGYTRQASEKPQMHDRGAEGPSLSLSKG